MNCGGICGKRNFAEDLAYGNDEPQNVRSAVSGEGTGWKVAVDIIVSPCVSWNLIKREGRPLFKSLFYGQPESH